MFDDPLVAIKDINKMSKHIGKDVAKHMNIPLNELKDYIKPKEIRSILQQYCIPKQDQLMINTLILKKVFQEVNNWVLGIQLCKMASNGQLEACWNEEENCMIFETKEK
ncbi:MAG: hypothetical protein EB127_22695 [Alphaproteobacteria bacterium]|nr:hypothetical protein [Alphaproteobacteria bacterium]